VRLGRGFEFDPEMETVFNDQEANELLDKTYRDHWARPQ
jgi:hypothetical protein